MSEETTKEKVVAARVPPDLHEKARIWSVKEGRPLSEIVRELLQQWIAKKEEKEPRQ